jgi:hypothetical protein
MLATSPPRLHTSTQAMGKRHGPASRSDIHLERQGITNTMTS